MFEPFRKPISPRLRRSARRFLWAVGIGQLLGVMVGAVVGYALSPGLIVTVVGALLGGAATIPLCWISFVFWSRSAHRVQAAESGGGGSDH